MASLCGGPGTAKSRYPPRVSEGAMPGGTLRIVVCIKQVPKAQELQVDPKTQTLKRVGVPSEINPPDANALELALRIKDRQPAEIVVVSRGPTAFDESLERAVAMGADRAVLLTDRILGGSDTVPTAYALSETIKKIGGEGHLPVGGGGAGRRATWAGGSRVTWTSRRSRTSPRSRSWTAGCGPAAPRRTGASGGRRRCPASSP